MFSREFSWICQNSYSKISGWLPLGQLFIFLDALVFQFKGLNIQNIKLTLLHGCFSCFLNCTNGTKSRNAPHNFQFFRVEKNKLTHSKPLKPTLLSSSVNQSFCKMRITPEPLSCHWSLSIPSENTRKTDKWPEMG